MKEKNNKTNQSSILNLEIERRDLLRYGAFSALGLTSQVAMPTIKAAPSDDEHFFIFVEMKGGVHWRLATDGYDLDALPDDPNVVKMYQRVSEDIPTTEEYDALVYGGPEATTTNGNYCLVPYFGAQPENSYLKGTTVTGANYILGPSGMPLKDHVNDIAVIRGVHMEGDFHESPQIFHGSDRYSSPHIASVLSYLLQMEKGYSSVLLDNIAMEGPAFRNVITSLANDNLPLTASSFGSLAQNLSGSEATELQKRFRRAAAISQAIQNASQGVATEQLNTFEAYQSALTTAPEAHGRLQQIVANLAAEDASLDLDAQLKTTLLLLQSGLTRVATLCLGSPNGYNNVDGFGLFDSHQGLLHLNPNQLCLGSVCTATQNNFQKIETAMSDLATFIQTLKNTPFRNGKSMFDVTTVVVSSEHGRTNNFRGNEAPGGTKTAFGNGHYAFNNNYLLFGKGVKGGQWIGDMDPVRGYGGIVDWSTIDSANIGDVSLDVGRATSYSALQRTPDTRPFEAPDVLRTIMKIAGVEHRFSEAYDSSPFVDAKAILPIIK